MLAGLVLAAKGKGCDLHVYTGRPCILLVHILFSYETFAYSHTWLTYGVCQNPLC